MAAQITIQHLRDAQQARDPEFVELLTRLLTQVVDEPPRREGAYTFDDFLAEQASRAYRRKSLEEKSQFRMEKLAALEADDAEVPLPDRLTCHEIIVELWNSDDIYSRDCLLRIIAEVPLVYGPFKALKRIFKEAEAKDDTEVYGALAARFWSASSATMLSSVSCRGPLAGVDGPAPEGRRREDRERQQRTVEDQPQAHEARRVRCVAAPSGRGALPRSLRVIFHPIEPLSH